MNTDPNESCFNVSNWRLPDPKELTSNLEDQATSRVITLWANDGSISLLDLYCYLEARFGPPNGISMLFRKPSSDNAIQWHYTLFFWRFNDRFSESQLGWRENDRKIGILFSDTIMEFVGIKE